MSDFAEYHVHTERMLDWLTDRYDEDDALSGARRHPRLWRAWSTTSQRSAIDDYQRCAARAFATPDDAWRWWWEVAARYHAFTLRRAVGAYSDRAGFDRAWLRAPR
jgi:hypothetical protein